MVNLNSDDEAAMLDSPASGNESNNDDAQESP